MAYGRIIQVTIGPPGGQGQQITGLHMSFKVKKALGLGIGGPTAELKIFNLSLNSYFQFVKINYGCAIAAGYQDESVGAVQQQITGPSGGQAQQTIGVPLTLFSGSIRFCRRYREGPDMITYIEAEGAMWNVGGAPYSIGMQPGVSVYSLLANLGSSLQISYPQPRGRPAKRCLRERILICGNGARLRCPTLRQDRFPFRNRGGGDHADPAAFKPRIGRVDRGLQSFSDHDRGFLSKGTGLLQPPQPEQISVGVPDETAEAPGGSQTLPEMRWKINSLLLPQVGPGDVMFVKSDYFANGQAYMMAVELEYTGDNRKDDWKTESRCIPVDSTGAQTTIQTSPYLQEPRRHENRTNRYCRPSTPGYRGLRVEHAHVDPWSDRELHGGLEAGGRATACAKAYLAGRRAHRGPASCDLRRARAIPGDRTLADLGRPPGGGHRPHHVLRGFTRCLAPKRGRIEPGRPAGRPALFDQRRDLRPGRQSRRNAQIPGVSSGLLLQYGAGGTKATALLKSDGTIELNGNSDRFVLWNELSSVLSTFLTNLKAAVASGCQGGSGGTIATVTLDISSAKSQTLKTGG